MARPTQTAFDWATDTNHVDPGEVWDGQPIKVVPSAVLIAAGFSPSMKPPAGWFNSILNRLGEWALFLDEITDTRTQVFSAALLQGEGSLAFSGSKPTDLPYPRFEFTTAAGGYLAVAPALLPPHVTITGARLICNTQQAADTLSLQLVSYDPDVADSTQTLVTSGGSVGDHDDTSGVLSIDLSADNFGFHFQLTSTQNNVGSVTNVYGFAIDYIYT